MKKKYNIVFTRAGGHWYRMTITNWVFFVVLVLPVTIAIIILLLNPFWFRDSAIRWFESVMSRLSIWKSTLLYRIYLGTDPEFWHSLKD